MIVITGAYGFIGSRLAQQLAQNGYATQLILVDDFSKKEKETNIATLGDALRIEREEFLPWFRKHYSDVKFVYHLGARTDTTEFDEVIFSHLNVNYSKAIWQICTEYKIPLVYASSAATYGDGGLGFDDDESSMPLLQPLNPYGWSKQNFDLWVLAQEEHPPLWAGLKFFNVYGYGEFHKGRMASVIMHSYHKIKAQGAMQLFKSHRPDFKDGHQSRDFVAVEDIVQMCLFFMEQSTAKSGIYNAGCGIARSFLDLTTNVFIAMDLVPNITFIDTPIDIRDKYQYFTQANMAKLRSIGYSKPFTSLEDGVQSYVKRMKEMGI
jgi:ADP-L-glycero-D-manno-heptose 6-epimerase